LQIEEILFLLILVVFQRPTARRERLGSRVRLGRRLGARERVRLGFIAPGSDLNLNLYPALTPLLNPNLTLTLKSAIDI
jgi:hypothetical protein